MKQRGAERNQGGPEWPSLETREREWPEMRLENRQGPTNTGP